MTWWGWLVLGALLFGAELLAIDAQFYLVFIGLSAALVGLAGLLGISMPEYVQWLVFAALSLVSMFTFRKSLYEKIRGGAVGFRESIAGESITVGSLLAPNAETRVKFRGSNWTARNVGSAAIEAGSRATVLRVEGLTLHVSAD